MIQSKYDIKLLNEYFKITPKDQITTSNESLYSYCNAITDSQKASVRRKKKQLLLKKNDTTPPGDVEEINSESVEKMILDIINGDSKLRESIVRLATDYLTKIKKDTATGLDKEKLNMEGFLEIEMEKRNETQSK